MSQVPGATDSDIRIQSDYDDGRAVYEGKIIYNEIEYEFEINAADGTILEWEAGSVSINFYRAAAERAHAADMVRRRRRTGG